MEILILAQRVNGIWPYAHPDRISHHFLEGNKLVLLRSEVSGLSFDDLDLRLDLPTGSLSYRPEPVSRLLTRLTGESSADLAASFAGDESAAPNGLFDLLAIAYAQWRTAGGRPIPAMEVSLASPQPLRLVPAAPRGPIARMNRATQSWLGLLDVHEDIA